MTIGKSSRKGSVRAPKFLDKRTGFYGRLDETEKAKERKGEDHVTGVKDGDLVGACPAIVLYTETEADQADPGVFEFNQGMIEDDDTLTLLRRKPGRLSSRWRRSIRKTFTVSASEQTTTEMETDVPVLDVTMVEVKSRWRRSTRKKQQAESQVAPSREEDLITGEEQGTHQSPNLNVLEVEIETGVEQREDEGKLVHFASRLEAEDQVLIKDKKRGREVEDVKERKLNGQEEMKKRSMLKNYRKAFDRAFRQGWETFITNLYSVTLAPVSSSSSFSSSATSKQTHQESVLVEYRVICKQQNIYTVEPMPVSPSSSPSPNETQYDSVLKEYRVICPRK